MTSLVCAFGTLRLAIYRVIYENFEIVTWSLEKSLVIKGLRDIYQNPAKKISQRKQKENHSITSPVSQHDMVSKVQK